MQLAAEREAQERKEERERREVRDKAQDELIAELKRAVDKGNNRRANFALWSPIIVAVITVAGAVLLARPG